MSALLSAAAPRGWLPFQRMAIESGALALRRSLVLSAPTSSGKTLVAEIALWRSVCAGRRAMLLVPTRALAEEVYASLRPRWEKAGRTVLLATRDRPTSDPLVRGGHFDLLVTIPEKARTFLVADPTFARGIGAVVIDEVQSISEPRRGATLDLLVTTLRRIAPTCRLVAITTPGPHVEPIRLWLDAALLETHERPRDLWEGVLDAETGAFHGRDASGREFDVPALDPVGTSPLPTSPHSYCRAASLEVAARCILNADQRLLLFVPTRDMAHEWGLGLAETLREDFANRNCETSHAPSDSSVALQLLRSSGGGSLAELLRPALEEGVGVHHGELPAELRAAIENDFRRGALRAIVATSTLSRGVNLHADTVINVPARVSGGRKGRHSVEPIDRRRLTDQGGRAGRVVASSTASAPPPPGLSLVIASGSGMAERMWQELFATESAAESFAPLAHESSATLALHAAVLGEAQQEQDFHAFLAGSHAATLGHGNEAAAWGGSGTEPLDHGLAEAQSAGLLMDVGHGRVSPTAIGEIVVGCGLQIATATLLLDWMRSVRRDHFEPLELLFVLAATPDGGDHPIRLSPMERERHSPLMRIRAELQFIAPAPASFTGDGEDHLPAHDLVDDVNHASFADDALVSGWLRDRWTRPGGFARAEQEAAKKALAAAAWLGPVSTLELEAEFSMFAGGFQALGRHLGWLAESAARIAEALSLHPTMSEVCASLGRRLPAGLPEGAEDLESLVRAAVDRDQLHRLAIEGFTTLEEVARGDADSLSFVLGKESAERSLSLAREELRWRERAAQLMPGATGSPTTWFAQAHPQPRAHLADPSSMPSAPPSVPSHPPFSNDTPPEPVGSPTDESASSDTPPAAPEGFAREDVPPINTPQVDVLRFDPKQPQIVGVGDKRVRLTGHQGRLLAALARDVGRCVEYETLLDRVWKGASVEQQQIAQHKRRLVQRLERAGLTGQIVDTVYGVGLSLFPDAPERLHLESPLQRRPPSPA